MDPQELERLIDRELRALPAPRAPRTLMPRVMEAARTGRLSPPVSIWPRLVLACAVVACIAAVPWILGSSVMLERVIVAVQATSLVRSLMQVVWRALLEPIVNYAGVLLLLMAFVSAAFWKAIRLVAWDTDIEGVSHS